MKTKVSRMLAWALPTLSMVFFGVQPCSAGTPPINTRITVISDFDGDGSVDPIRREVRTHETDFVVGRIIIERGSDGTVLAEFASPEPGDYFGWSVMAMPDLNNDGLPEIAVAAPGALIDAGGPDGAGARLGRVHLISPARGVELWSSPAPIFADHAFMYAHAQTLARCGDINADGYPDIVIGVSRYSIIDQDPLGGNNNPAAAPALPAPLWVAVSGRDGSHLAIDESSIFNTGLPNLDTLHLEASNDLEAWRLFQAHGRRLVLEGVPGDLTGDGVIDELDISALLRALAAAEHKSDTPPATRFDLDNDGTIGAGDLAALLARVGDIAPHAKVVKHDRGAATIRRIDRPKLPPVDCNPGCDGNGGGGPNDADDTPFDGDGPGGGGPDGGPGDGPNNGPPAAAAVAAVPAQTAAIPAVTMTATASRTTTTATHPAIRAISNSPATPTATTTTTALPTLLSAAAPAPPAPRTHATAIPAAPRPPLPTSIYASTPTTTG